MRVGGNSNNLVNTLGYEVQDSLLELLTREDTLVKQLNTANHAMVLASKTSARMAEYKHNVKVTSAKLEETRKEIQLYLLNVLGVSINGMIKDKEPTSGQAYIRRERMIESLYESDE